MELWTASKSRVNQCHSFPNASWKQDRARFILGRSPNQRSPCRAPSGLPTAGFGTAQVDISSSSGLGPHRQTRVNYRSGHLPEPQLPAYEKIATGERRDTQNRTNPTLRPPPGSIRYRRVKSPNSRGRPVDEHSSQPGHGLFVIVVRREMNAKLPDVVNLIVHRLPFAWPLAVLAHQDQQVYIGVEPEFSHDSAKRPLHR